MTATPVPGEDVRPLVEERIDNLRITVYTTREALGRAAGAEVAARLRRLGDVQARVRIAFAAAPSQNELLDELARADAIAWSRVDAFQLDEYVEVPSDAPSLFRSYLSERILDRVRPGRVELVDPAANPQAEAERYARALAEAPLDVALLGIGENGHLAFNDPPHARFNDSQLVRIVTLSPESRRQQVADGCFATLTDVPRRALTLTIPTLLAARHVFCVVPGPRKRAAVARALRGPVHPSCPASILRRHPSARLFLDVDSYPGSGAG